MRSLLRGRPVLLAAVVLAVAAGGAEVNKAANGPLDRAALDATIHKTLREIINQGADLYNGGDTAGCYRLYEGALLTLRPLLDHHPDLQTTINNGVRDARQTTEQLERAFILRRVIDQIRTTVNPAATARKNPEPIQNPEPIKIPTKSVTLWDRLGGEEGVAKVVEEVLDAAVADPKVNFLRDGKLKLDEPARDGLKKKIVEQISSATGGPYRYKGKTMKATHAGMGITEDQFDAFSDHFKKALARNGAKPDDVELVLAFIGGTRRDIVAPKLETPPEPTPGPTTTLWERLGGVANVTKMVDDFVAAAGADPKVNFTRGGKYQLDPEDLAELKKKLVDQISAASGGPFKYTGKTMKAAHAGMAITDAEFDALAGHLKAALEKNGVKAEDVKQVLAVVESTRKDIVEAKKEEKEEKKEPQE